MRKKRRSVFAIGLTISLLFSTYINAFAKDTVVTNVGQNLTVLEEEISPQSGARPCPGTSSGQHGMQGRGQGNAYDLSDNLRISRGTASRCLYCNLIMITKNNPFQVPTLAFGNYALRGVDDPVQSGVVNLWTSEFGYSAKNSEFSKMFYFIRNLRSFGPSGGEQ